MRLCHLLCLSLVLLVLLELSPTMARHKKRKSKKSYTKTTKSYSTKTCKPQVIEPRIPFDVEEVILTLTNTTETFLIDFNDVIDFCFFLDFCDFALTDLAGCAACISFSFPIPPFILSLM